jgi:hypothetical protein
MAGPLEQSSRRVPKVTQISLPKPQSQQPADAIVKASYARSLVLQPGDVDSVLQAQQAPVGGPPLAVVSPAVADLLRRMEGTPLPSSLPRPSAFAAIPDRDLLSFGEALQGWRSTVLAGMTSGITDAAEPVSGPEVAAQTARVNSAVVANQNFKAAGAVSPVGMLSLERLEMTPAGLTRGDLIGTIPLAPGETTSVYQKEWSVTSSEFTSIVTDSLANYSETGVTQNTELAQSTTAQNTHNNQYNVTASASGGCGFVSGSTSASAGGSDAVTQGQTQSRNDAVKVTRQASTRVKQEHKMSIATSTVTGSAEGSTRTLSNPGPDAIRIDYFSLIEEWRVRLFQYGLRLTYDITVLEPGATLREPYAQLEDLQSQVDAAFEFGLRIEDITPSRYTELVDTYGAQIPPPPEPRLKIQVGGVVPGLDTSEDWHWYVIPVTVPDGYWVTSATLTAHVGLSSSSSPLGPGNVFGVEGTPFYNQPPYPASPPQGYGPVNLTQSKYGNYLYHYTGTFNIPCFIQYSDAAWVQVVLETEPTTEAVAQWASSAWTACYNAAQAAYYSKQQQVNGQISDLESQINGVDTLTLRREENDEIMKGILRFMIGAGFDFMSPGVVTELNAIAGGRKDVIEHGEAFASPELSLSAAALSILDQYGAEISFINEAIEWENLIFYLDSYFWDVPASWDFIRQIRNSDAQRQAFLRAGSARVVVPIRKGYETAWLQFVHTGSLTGTSSPYMTIAEEIQNYDNTNYPGIPPANPADSGSSVMAATTTSQALTPSLSPVQITVESGAGFVVGYTALIDSGQNAESQLIVDAGPTYLTVQYLVSAHDGSVTPLPIVQDYEAGVLIAEWNEYTPTSGTDIAVSSDLTTID